MKKLINKTIILSLFVALTGCNDWLDVSPKADMKAEDLFGTEAGFQRCFGRCLCIDVRYE